MKKISLIIGMILYFGVAVIGAIAFIDLMINFISIPSYNGFLTLVYLLFAVATAFSLAVYCYFKFAGKDYKKIGKVTGIMSGVAVIILILMNII